MKVCAKCGHSKPPEEFRSHPDGRTEKTCRPCERLASQAWKRANAERDARTKKAWKQAHPESVKASAKKSRETHPGKTRAWIDAWRKANPVEKAAAEKAWRTANRGRANATNRLRVATQIRATPPWADHEAIRRIYDLAARRTKATGFPWHVDHIVPLRSPLVSGLHVEHNLRVIPAAENIAKGNRHWPEMP